jgi:hypothetical protein
MAELSRAGDSATVDEDAFSEIFALMVLRERTKQAVFHAESAERWGPGALAIAATPGGGSLEGMSSIYREDAKRRHPRESRQVFRRRPARRHTLSWVMLATSLALGGFGGYEVIVTDGASAPAP